MDRRHFIKTGAAVAAGAALTGVTINEAAAAKPAKRGKTSYSSEKGKATDEDILVRFLGTGAADWDGKDERGEQRRLTSALIDGKVLIDFTPTDEDMLPAKARPQTIFYTHSHGDHYNPAAALRLGIKTVYLGETWANRAFRQFKKTSEDLGLPMPEIIPLAVAQSVEVEGIRFTAMPANHATSDDGEQTLMYLIEQGEVRVMYATDTGGIPARAARIAGIDRHVKSGKAISGLIMEATMGIEHDLDFRIYTHSSVGTVHRIAQVLLETKRLVAPEGQPVYLTHLARTLNGTQAELDAQLPEPLRAAYDGLEVIFRKA